MKNLQLYCTVLGLTLLMSLGFLSAQTPIMGKIYNSDYTNIISDASIMVSCGSNSLSTTSLYDGAYVVRFDPTICKSPDVIKVDATKDNLIGSKQGDLIECDNVNCTGEYFSIVNLAMSVKPTSSSSSGGGSSGGGSSYKGYYNCGNNICDTGESNLTCPKDCVKELPKNEVVELGFNENTQEETDQTPEITTQENKETNFVSGITGAAIGFGKTNQGRSAGALILIVIVIAIAVLVNKNK